MKIPFASFIDGFVRNLRLLAGILPCRPKFASIFTADGRGLDANLKGKIFPEMPKIFVRLLLHLRAFSRGHPQSKFMDSEKNKLRERYLAA